MPEILPIGQDARALAQRLRANRAKKYVVDLSVARTDTSIAGEAGISDKAPFLSLSVLKVGNGTFTLKQKFADDSTIEYAQDELSDGYVMDREYVDILFTNTAQAVTNPKLLFDWRET